MGLKFGKVIGLKYIPLLVSNSLVIVVLLTRYHVRELSLQVMGVLGSSVIALDTFL